MNGGQAPSLWQMRRCLISMAGNLIFDEYTRLDIHASLDFTGYFLKILDRESIVVDWLVDGFQLVLVTTSHLLSLTWALLVYICWPWLDCIVLSTIVRENGSRYILMMGLSMSWRPKQVLGSYKWVLLLEVLVLQSGLLLDLLLQILNPDTHLLNYSFLPLEFCDVLGMDYFGYLGVTLAAVVDLLHVYIGRFHRLLVDLSLESYDRVVEVFLCYQRLGSYFVYLLLELISLSFRFFHSFPELVNFRRIWLSEIRA